MPFTFITTPPVSPNVLSASYPALIRIGSNAYGTTGVTQFRYVAIVTGLSALGTKYTVPHTAGLSDGVFDVSELFKTAIKLSPLEYGGADFLPTAPWPIQQAEFPNVTFTVQIKEQYYSGGSFITNNGGTFTFIAGRGWTDQTDNIWGITNWYQYNGLSDFIPYSGLARIMIAQRTEDPAWTSTAVNPYLNIRMTYKNVSGGTKLISNYEFDRTALGFSKVVYQTLYKSGQTDDADYGSVEIQVSTRPSIAGADTVEETYEITKNLDTCVDEEAVIMFQDRFFQWSFMSFSMKQSTSVNAQTQEVEVVDGRFRYNVKSSDVLTLNTDWMEDAQNEMMKDLLVTEKCYLMATDGSLEQVTVVPNSLRLQTSRMDGLFQYTMQFRKSLDNFRA